MRSGELDALVTGAPPALRVIVRDESDDALRNVLNDVLRQQVLDAQLAEAGLDPQTVARNIAERQRRR